MDAVVIVDVLAAALLLAAAMWLAGHPAENPPANAARDPRAGVPPAPDSVLAAARLTVAWASGSRADWDRHVRPVLAREFDAMTGGRRSAGDRAVTGELLFGPELWPLVDPAGTFGTGLDLPG
ncbi:MAG: hypothetical protein ACRDQB_05600, partial [Thermocrispum sp.]